MLAVSSVPLLMGLQAAPRPWRGLTKSCHPRPAKNGRPLFMNKDALRFLKRGRGGALSYLGAVETIGVEVLRQALEPESIHTF